MADGRGLRGLSLQRVYPRPPGLGCRDDIGPAFSALTPLPGQSLVPALQSKPLGERTLAWEHEGNRVVRVGDWEPYDLSRDRAELTNLAAQQSTKVKELILISLNAFDYYEFGFRIHVRSALKCGASEDEILEALEVVGIHKLHALTSMLPVLVEEVENFKQASGETGGKIDDLRN